MAETGRVFIWVQHLLGIGHLMRMAHIARHLAAKGWQVDLASGGLPVEGLDVGAARFHQLAPLKAADAAFSGLADAEGNPPDEAFLTARAADTITGASDTCGAVNARTGTSSDCLPESREPSAHSTGS